MTRMYTASLLMFVWGTCSVQAQECNTNIYPSAPKERFEVVVGSNGAEVLDLDTNLVWQRCSVGQQWQNTTQRCTGTPVRYTWVDALKQAHALGGDYRLPNIKELHTLHEPRCSTPSINVTLFPDTPSTDAYWSSSPAMRDSNGAWRMSFDLGSTDVGAKADANGYVRAVRASAAQPQ